MTSGLMPLYLLLLKYQMSITSLKNMLLVKQIEEIWKHSVPENYEAS